MSDSSVGRDRGIKKRLYARAGVGLYWIVNLADRRVEVYTSPAATDPPDYATRTDYGPDDAVPVVLDGVAVGAIRVADVLP